MSEVADIIDWVDRDMQFDKWYKVKSKKQKNLIINAMDSGFIPDCEFDSGYKHFRKSQLAYEVFFITDDE